MAAGRMLAARYRLDEPIGRGGMGQVWHGWDVTLRRPVAVKLLHAELSDPRGAELFLNEARLAAGLGHPGIVTVHDLGHEPDGTAYLVMELLTGTDLAVRLRTQGPPPLAEAVGWALQLCDALAFAHAARVVHRDLKPANLFLARDGRLKILDFGIAKHREGGTDSHSRVMGTVAYLPPERFHGRSGDHRGDLYALGCVLFELLTGRPPFGSGDPVPLMLRHLSEPPRPPGPEAPGPVPPELDRLVLDLLAKDPDARPRSATEVAARLAALPTDRDTLVLSPATAPTAPTAPLPAPAPTLRLPSERTTLAALPEPGPGPGPHATEPVYVDWIRTLHADGRLPAPERMLARHGHGYQSTAWARAAARAWPAAGLGPLLAVYEDARLPRLANEIARSVPALRDPAELPAVLAGLRAAGQHLRLTMLTAAFEAHSPEPVPSGPAPSGPAPSEAAERAAALSRLARLLRALAAHRSAPPRETPRGSPRALPQDPPGVPPFAAVVAAVAALTGAGCADEASFLDWIRAQPPGGEGRFRAEWLPTLHQVRHSGISPDDLVSTVARAWPAAELGAAVAAFHRAGLFPVAERLTCLAASLRTPAELPAVVSGFRRSGQQGRLCVLLWEVGHQPPPSVAAAAASLTAAGELDAATAVLRPQPMTLAERRTLLLNRGPLH
ncbi:serine/threonine-protein kinase [Kitasatospora phosalacinea]|uniref:non-specific serine/threonine protein kinase n=1 Tax=Kitasatospora phosalacinea TaxID=2065 RepID=A0ABW6GK98_9ACTN